MRRWVPAVVAATLLLTSCTSHSSSARFRIAASSALFDAPLGVTITGLSPGSHVTVEASAKDTTDHTWTSRATYVADASGQVDPATAAPLDGSYSGVSDTGLLWSMSADGSSTYVAPDGVMAVHLTASVNHHQVAAGDLTRQMRGAAVTEHTTTAAQEGFDGVLFTPGDAWIRRPALLAFGGSEGGTANGTLVARAVAAKGYPALGIAYFKAPGLPDSLTNIPLEYFANALRWLAKQPGVDPRHIDVYGVSRGSEAALLLGVDFPDLVFGVVAASPSSVVNGGSPDTTQPAWTLHGRPVPAAPESDYNDPHPADAPAAIIPAERITGPVLIVCGESDLLWKSCAYSDALSDRLGTHPHTERREPGAGHFVGSLVPNVPYEPPAREGGVQQGDALGRLDAWANLLGFLAAQAS